MIRALYDWTLRLAETPHALWALAAVSFVESSVFPIPPDVLIVPMVLARPDRAWLIAGVCTVASVLGGLFGYLLGAVLMEEVARPVLEFYGKGEMIGPAVARFREFGFWAVFGAGLTPFPYKVITVASGAASLDLVAFTVASVLARGARFFLVAALLWRFGAPIRAFIEKYLGALTIAFFALLIGGFAVLGAL